MWVQLAEYSKCLISLVLGPNEPIILRHALAVNQDHKDESGIDFLDLRVLDEDGRGHEIKLSGVGIS